MENKSGEAKVQKVKNWSPVWIFPIVTALIGAPVFALILISRRHAR